VAVALGACAPQAEPPVEQPVDESFIVPGLQAPVDVLIDEWGVSHVYAANSDDLFLAQGWNAARDRLWQLDLWKRRGDGTLAEVLGPEYVSKDRAARLLLYRGDLYEEWLAYASDTKRITSSFVAGVNAWIDTVLADPERLPLEFEALDYQPAHWTPETVVRIRSHGLLRNVRSEVARALFLDRHGAAALALRDRFEPEHELVMPEGLDPSWIDDSVLADYALGTGGVRFESPEQQASWTGTAPEMWSDVARGSNNWAVAPDRTATGRPILANDPHRALAVPSLRYITHLSAPELDVIGAGEPALPGVSIGHNGTIAFGLTVFSIDQEDLYVYETRPGEPPEYLYEGRWEPMRELREPVDVRGAESQEVVLRFTRHGPVLHEDAAAGRAFALRAAWLQPGMAPYLGSIEYMRARDWDGFLAAMNRWGLPGENQVYADVDGNIGWKPGGRAPIRPDWDGLLPVPGDGRYEWAGFYDMDQLPVEANPTRGWVATANQMNLPAGYPHQVGFEWAAPYRHSRIAEVLAGDDRLSIDSALRLQTDYSSLPARRLVQALAGLEPANERQAAALVLLREWDGRLAPSSAAAALFEVWLRRHLPDAVWGRKAELEGLDEAAAEALEGAGSRRTLDLAEQLLAAGDGAAQGAILDSLEGAFDEVGELTGAPASDWQWGSLHHSRLEHPLAEQLRAFGVEPDVGPLPRGGSADTVGNTSYRSSDFRQVSGASFRMVLDVGEWDRSVAMNSPGQSGDPRSPHYADLFEPWAQDRAFPLLYSRDAVLEATRTRLRLLPE
jgi:penicillin amidase